ncbi:MAG TPA: DNA methyltransferase [Bacteroidota bacterium]
MFTSDSRKSTLATIKSTLPNAIRASSENLLLAEGNSFELLQCLPNHSVSLVLTDPPYHTTRKENIRGDRSFKNDDEYLDWMGRYSEKWYRVLKPNGSLLCFCSPAMAGRLESVFSRRFNILSHIVWAKPNDPGFDGWKQKMKKEALRQWYSHTERIIFAEPAYEGNVFRSYFGKLIREKRNQSGLSMHQVTQITGDYGKVNHGGAVSNWEAGRNVPSAKQYERLCEALKQTGKVHSMPKYGDVVRPFAMDSSKEFTDVWNFPSVRPYKGKHPAEKPLSLLEHAIEATTNRGDIVLDCFAGSGSTGLAALNLGRRAVLMEVDGTWIMRITEKLQTRLRKNGQKKNIEISSSVAQRILEIQTPLFADSK